MVAATPPPLSDEPWPAEPLPRHAAPSDDGVLDEDFFTNSAGAFPATVAEASKLSPECGVGVCWRLRSNIGFWKDVLCAPPSVLQVIKEGYKLPFVSEPSPFVGSNSVSASKYGSFVSCEVARLVREGVLLPVKHRPAGVCGLSVDDSRTKLRLICNAIPLNVFTSAPRFKFETVGTARDLLTSDDRVVQFDLHAAYHHVRMWPGHIGWLGLWWEGQYYVFLALPFGLNSAPYCFTKITRALVRHFRAQGLRCAMMLDDGLIAIAPGQEERVAWVRAVLDSSGFLVAEEKCRWTPSPRTEGFLGFTMDLTRGELGITARRLEKIGASLAAVNTTRPVRRRELAALLGRIISASLVLGPVARLASRASYEIVGGDADGWDRFVEWSVESVREMDFWRVFWREGGFARCVPLWDFHRCVDVWVSSDASENGVGVVCGDVRVALPLPPASVGASSTHRELVAVLLGLQAIPDLLRGRRVGWRVDNQAAAAILRIGSKAPDCQLLAWAVYEATLQLGSSLHPTWVPREENVAADELSKSPDADDYGLTRDAFRRFCTWFGVSPSIDLFASFVSAQCERFFTRGLSPGGIGVDAFLHSWSEDVCLYCFPPVPVLGRVFRRLLDDGRRCAVIILPVWPSQPWWPLFAPDGAHSRREIRGWLRVHRRDLVRGPAPPQFLTKGGWNLRMIAVLWDSTPLPRPFRPFCARRFLGQPCPAGC